VSLQDAVVNLIRVSLRDHQWLGHTMPRTGNQLGAGVPGTTYRCDPGGPNDHVFIFAHQPQMWHALLRAIERPDLIGDPRYEKGPARWERKAEVDALVEAWTSTRTKHEVVKILADFAKAPPDRYASWLFTKGGDFYHDPNGLPDLTALQRNIDLQQQLGFLKAKLDVKKYADLSLVEEAAKRAK